MRTFYARSLRELKQTIKKGVTYKDVWQAGKSAGSIEEWSPPPGRPLLRGRLGGSDAA